MMIEGVEGGRACFVRCLRGRVRVGDDGGNVVEEKGGLGDEDEEDDGRGDRDGTVMRRGEVWVVRWEGVRRAVERGVVEVL